MVKGREGKMPAAEEKWGKTLWGAKEGCVRNGRDGGGGREAINSTSKKWYSTWGSTARGGGNKGKSEAGRVGGANVWGIGGESEGESWWRKGGSLGKMG